MLKIFIESIIPVIILRLVLHLIYEISIQPNRLRVAVKIRKIKIIDTAII